MAHGSPGPYCSELDCTNSFPCVDHPGSNMEEDSKDVPKLSTRVIVVFGPPGSGKGTQCQLLAQRYGFVHVSTGDMFREAVTKDTKVGQLAGPQLAKSDFVSDDLVIKLVLDRLAKPDVMARGALLDGFPRTPAQARAILAAVDVESFFLLMASDDRCVERILKRKIDPATGAIFHTDFAPPPPEVKDRVRPRPDDENEIKIRARLRGYHKVLSGVLPFFNGIVHVVDGLAPAADVHQQIIEQGLLENSQAYERAAKRAAELEAAKQISNCSVCHTQLATWVVLPCLHVCCCSSCVARKSTCPNCGRGVEARVRMKEGDGEESKTPEEDDGWGDEDPEPVEEAPVVSLSCHPCEPIPQSGLVDVAISVKVKSAPGRVPIDLCCVVDVSGSMRSLATYEEDGKMKDDGLSVLDIVKHATRAVIRLLTPQDRFSLVAFDTYAELKFPLSLMDDKNKGEAEAALDKLTPKASTNLWAGLLTGMDSLRTAPKSENGAKMSVMLLTDGVPNAPPPRGYVGELKHYLETHPSFSFQLSTFGFGSKLDSNLLLELAQTGNGIFAFIPDAKIVGTCFVNSVANAACARTQTAKLHLNVKNGSTFAGDVRGNLPVTDAQWAKVVALGSLQYDQSREVVVPLRIAASEGPYLEAHLVYPNDNEGEHKVTLLCSDRTPTPEALVALARSEMVTATAQALAECKSSSWTAACQRITTLNTHMAAWQASHPEAVPLLERLVVDTTGRLAKGFSTQERINRWGRHYAAALMRAHQLQLCTNFMDPGLQAYKGENFKELSEQGGKIFVSLPAPKPQEVVSSWQTLSTQGKPTPAAAPPPMENYYAGEGGGCFAGDCTVLKLQGDVAVPVRVRDVRAGDRVAVAGGDFVRVRFVTEIACHSLLVPFEGGLLLTPSHPVRINGTWHKPKHLSSARVENAEQVVYNFVLETTHIVLVNGVECVTWGHGLTDLAVAHEFYGSMQRITNVLAKLPTRNGLISVQQSLRACA